MDGLVGREHPHFYIWLFLFPFNFVFLVSFPTSSFVYDFFCISGLFLFGLLVVSLALLSIRLACLFCDEVSLCVYSLRR